MIIHIDKNEDVRNSFRAVYSEGYDIPVWSSDYEQAFDVLSEYGDKTRLVVTEIFKPFENFSEFIRRAQARGINVIVFTGHTEKEYFGEAEKHFLLKIIQKPDTADLANWVLKFTK